MFRFLLSMTAGLVFSTAAVAHFVFVVPQTGDGVLIVFSDDLEPDSNVPIAKIAALELFARDEAGKDWVVKTIANKSSLKATAPAGTRVLHGHVPYGVVQKGEAPPFLLSYHPKAILGDAFSAKALVGERTPIEVVAVGKPGEVRFQAIARGKPLANADMTVLIPGGTSKKVTTDGMGLSPVFSEKGKFGVWTKVIDATPGEADGKKYNEARRYATLVVEVK